MSEGGLEVGAAIAGLNVLAARIYSNSELWIGSRVKIMEVWRGAR